MAINHPSSTETFDWCKRIQANLPMTTAATILAAHRPLVGSLGHLPHGDHPISARDWLSMPKGNTMNVSRGYRKK
jgi:hypothetical protein